jgi:hypothetical protein
MHLFVFKDVFLRKTISKYDWSDRRSRRKCLNCDFCKEKIDAHREAGGGG